MPRLQSVETIARHIPLLGSFLDNLIHPNRDPDDADPGKPFTPPPPEKSKQEKEDEDDDGPTFPMDPALA
jgi:hypothetical protein